MLFIDADQDAETGWEGFDYIVNRENSGTTWLERNTNGWNWERVAQISFKAEGNELQLRIPREYLGLPAGQTGLNIDFKWSDNLQKPGDVMDFYLSGDTAPEGRFKYRYETR